MKTESFRTTCLRDCPDACGIVATVREGRIVTHRGDPDHGITRGFLCQRGNRFLERFYDPRRLLHPLQRTRGGWERIAWDDALDRVAERLLACKREAGPRSVLVVNYSGVRGQVARVLGRLFWAHFGGATHARGGLSVEANEAAQHLDFGGCPTHDPVDHAHSSAFVVWGKNVAVTRVHSLPFIQAARAAGAPLVVIDPIWTATAQRADRFYCIRPGTDGLLAVGIARLLLERGSIADAFVAQHTQGFEAYRSLVLSHSLDEVAAATDLTLSQLEELADLYATRKPLATLVGLGASYWPHSGDTVRLIDALAALSGNVGVSGGGVHTDLDSTAGLDLSMVRDAPAAEYRTVLLPRLGEDITAARDPSLEMAWIAGANPAATAPDTHAVRGALQSIGFKVVVEQFMTATAELADLVLPCTTYLEMDDLACSYGHHWLGVTRPVVPPLGEAKSDVEILQLLATRLGFGEALAGTPDAWMRRLLAPLAERGLTLEDLKRGPRAKPGFDTVPFADRRFGTPSGRFEFVDGYHAPEVQEDGLYLVATKTVAMLNSQILERDLPEEPVVHAHPSVLEGMVLGDGDEIWVESRVGRVRARIVGDEKVRRDVLLFNPALWRGDLAGVNQLREARLTDVGDAAAMHATRVRLRRVGEGPVP